MTRVIRIYLLRMIRITTSQPGSAPGDPRIDSWTALVTVRPPHRHRVIDQVPQSEWILQYSPHDGETTSLSVHGRPESPQK
jgi:hypothetical protein